MRKPSRGMTLIELMVALLVLSILVGIAVPSFREFSGNSKASAASSSLTTALSLARSEALSRGRGTRVCASANAATCAGSTNWTTGWIVYSDTDNDGAVDADEVIQRWQAAPPGVTVTATADRAAYDAMGMNSAVAAVTFTVTFDGCIGNRARQSVLSPTGSVQTTQVACP